MKKEKLRRTRKKTDPPDDSFLKVNKWMLRIYGPEVAVFISNLIDKHLYWKDHNKNFDGSFFHPYKTQTYETKMSTDILRKCKEKAVLNDWITTRLKGIPPKEWYVLNMEHSDIQLMMGKSNGMPLENPINYDGKIQSIYKETLNKENNNPPSLDDEKDISFYGKINTSMFNKFWEIFPKKINKAKSKKQWDILCSKEDRPDWRTIRIAIQEQIKSDLWQTNRFIKTPEKWIEEEYWNQDPKEMINWNKEVNECPISGRIFGKDFRPQTVGCHDCEEEDKKLYNKCKKLYESSYKQ